MLGVDEFKSMDHMESCYEKAQKHIEESPFCLKVSIGLTALIWLDLLAATYGFSILSGIMTIAWIVGMIALYSFHGTWKYLGKMMTKPLRMNFGLLVLLKFFLLVLCAQCCMVFLLLAPFIPVAYERYLDGKTVENVENIVSYYQLQYGMQNAQSYAPQNEGTYGTQTSMVYNA